MPFSLCMFIAWQAREAYVAATHKQRNIHAQVIVCLQLVLYSKQAAHTALLQAAMKIY